MIEQNETKDTAAEPKEGQSQQLTIGDQPQTPTNEADIQKNQPKTAMELSDGIKLSTIDELWRFSCAVSKSGLAPKGMEKAEAIMIAIEMGLEVGLKPMAALQNIAVINGRPSIWGDAAKALVLSSGFCEYIKETYEGEGTTLTAVCVSKRKGEANVEHKSTFSVADAQKAKLWTKSGPWTDYPARMLMMRARAFNLRDNFPDVLKGLAVREEVADHTEISSKTNGSSKVETYE